jgi:hypothetical protein
MRKYKLILVCFITTLLATTASLASDFPRHSSSDTSSWIYNVRPAMKFGSDGTSCLPIAAVSPTGQANGGLNTSGKPAGDCRSTNLTQAYTRAVCQFKSGTWDLYCGVMYAYYFEKDQFLFFAGGHRHDWEHVMMWVKMPNYNMSQVTSQFLTVSAHGDYTHHDLRSNPSIKTKNDRRAHVYYHRIEGFFTNGMAAISNSSYEADEYVSYTSWNSLTSAQRNTLDTHDFGSATLRLNDTHFTNIMRNNTPPGWPVSY